jgi:drug/metabolite transporter (DMT)-like permease
MTTAHLQLLGAVVLFSTGGAAIKACSLTSWQVACLRAAVAAVALVIVVPAARPPWTWRSLAVGAAQGATMIFFVLATKLTTAANAIFLQSTFPLYVLLLAPLLLRERLRRGELVFMAALAAGMGMLIAGTPAATAIAPNPAAGNVLAVLGGLTWALTILGLRWMAAGESSLGAAIGAVAVANALACAGTLPLALPFERIAPADWAVIAYLGVFQIAGAYVLLSRGLRHVPALEASLLLLLEPVLNPVWAWAVHGEQPGAWSLAGGAVIVVATGLKVWIDGREKAAG